MPNDDVPRFQRTTLALACVSATAFAGHGGYYDDLGYGHGSLYGYGLGGMSYGLNYGRPALAGYGRPALGGYGKAVISKPQLFHGSYGHGLSHGGRLTQHGLNFGGYEQNLAVPSAGFLKGYGIGHDLGTYGGGYGAGYAVGYGKAISAPISGASIAIGKGYGDLPHGGGYGSLAGYGGKAIATGPIVRELGGIGLAHSYGAAGLAGQGYRNAGLGHAYGGANHRLVDYSKGLSPPLTVQKNFAVYGDELGYGGRYGAPFVTGTTVTADAGTASYGKSRSLPLFRVDTF